MPARGLAEQKAATLRIPETTKTLDVSKMPNAVCGSSFQGLKKLQPSDNESSFESNVDIVLIPGLGDDPESSFESAKTGWNWAKSPDGIIKDFPKARVLLYTYESAWVRSFKTKQFVSNIAHNLLICLKHTRKDCKQRPIVFIGHGIGGLVISKSVVLASARRDLYPVVFEAIAATIFFGTPFKGAGLASWAAMHTYILEKVKETTSSNPLKFLKLGDEALQELRLEFMKIIGRPTHSIRAICFWEQQQSDFSNIADLLIQSGVPESRVPTGLANFVSHGSATLDGVSHLGLASSHRELVKFDGPKDERWNETVREHLKGAINGVWLLVQDRVALARNMDWPCFIEVMKALRSIQVDRKRQDLEKTIAPSSWTTEDSEYLKWIEMANDQGETVTSAVLSVVDCLWICGRTGRGKTGTTIASLRGIETLIKQTETQSPGQGKILFAYFFCDPSADYCTAEDLLKSLLSQLIRQQAVLAYHAKPLVRKSGAPNTRAHMTVENLWQCLQDLLSDKAIGHRVFLVINNLHALPVESNSTIKLIKYLESEMQDVKPSSRESPAWRVSTRWLITSQDNKETSRAFLKPSVRLMDLDGKYGNRVQRDLQKYAKEKVAILETGKRYSKAIAYFASSLIGMRAPDVHWIDIVCVQLERLSEAESHLKVRRILEDTPQDLGDFLSEEWRRIFAANDDNGEKMREMLRALILVYESPTEAELGVLAGFSATYESQKELRSLIECCKPLLSVKQRVSFMNSTVRTHLLEHSRQLLGLSGDEIKWQHGILALRSLAHLKGKFGFPSPEHVEYAELVTGTSTGVSESGEGGFDSIYETHSDIEDNYARDPDPEDDDSSAAEILNRALAYPVKYWLRHGSKATAEFAEDLSLDDDFWKPDSITRHRWLLEYTRIVNDFEDFDVKSMTAMHVVAAIGFRQLMSALIRNGHKKEMNAYDSLSNTPLHLAAAFGRSEIIDELLDHGAVIDSPGERVDETPLHTAAEVGHVDAMKRLILRGADVNRYSQSSGLAINAAILAGNMDAIALLVQQGSSLNMTRDDVESPLAQAAAVADVSVVELLVQSSAGQISPQEYSKALVSAAGNGRTETFKMLLQFQHSPEDFQLALDKAAEGAKWEIVAISLEKGSNLNCDKAFYLAATGTDSNSQVLGDLWEHTHGGISVQTVNESLFSATDRGEGSMAGLLLRKFGADANAIRDKYGNALTAAAHHGRIDILRLLLEASADVKSPHGWALHAAATQGHREIVEELLSRGADANALTTNPNCPNGTALQGATENGHLEIVELLLQHGANPDLGGDVNTPAVLAAAISAEEEILLRLVDMGANVNVYGGDDHSTPLINASRFIKGSKTLQSLLKVGADINAANKDGKTALIAAAEHGDAQVVQFLLSHGADIMHTMDNGMTALKAALKSNVMECVEILVDHISSILSALKFARDSGNAAVISVIGTATKPLVQALDYDVKKELGSTNVHPGDPKLLINGKVNVRGNRREVSGTDKTTNTATKEYLPNVEPQSGYYRQPESNSSRDQNLFPYHRRSISLTPRPRTPRRSNTERPYGRGRWSPPPPIPEQVYHEYGGNELSARPNPPELYQEDTPAKRNAVMAAQGLPDYSFVPAIRNFHRANTAPLAKTYKAYRPGVRIPSEEDNIPTQGAQAQHRLNNEFDHYDTSSMAVNYDSGLVAVSSYPDFTQPQDDDICNGEQQIYTTPGDQYQHFDQSRAGRWTSPSDLPYQDTFPYADYTEATITPRLAQRPSTQLYFNSTAATAQNHRYWTPQIPSPSPPMQDPGLYMDYYQEQYYDTRNDGTQHPGDWQPPPPDFRQEGYNFSGVYDAYPRPEASWEGGREEYGSRFREYY